MDFYAHPYPLYIYTWAKKKIFPRAMGGVSSITFFSFSFLRYLVFFFFRLNCLSLFRGQCDSWKFWKPFFVCSGIHKIRENYLPHNLKIEPSPLFFGWQGKDLVKEGLQHPLAQRSYQVYDVWNQIGKTTFLHEYFFSKILHLGWIQRFLP